MNKNIQKPLANQVMSGNLPFFFLNPEEDSAAVDLLSYSEDFYKRHSKVLPEDGGVVSMMPQLSESGQSIPLVETIIFDARPGQEYQYLWEITHGEGGARKIWQLRVFLGAFYGRYIETNAQGTMLNSTELEPEDKNQVQSHLINRLDSPEVEANIQLAYAQKESIKITLAELAIIMAIEQDKGLTPSKTLIQTVEGRQKLLAATGFAPLRPYVEPPTVSPEHVESVLEFWEQYRANLKSKNEPR